MRRGGRNIHDEYYSSIPHVPFYGIINYDHHSSWLGGELVTKKAAAGNILS